MVIKHPKYFTLLLFLATLFSQAQPQEALQIAFYNVENLFHPSDDSLTRDEEFTPQGERYWSFYRYKEKSNRTAKVLLSLGAGEPPACVGLAEIENRQVLEDLAQSPVLSKAAYKIVHFESPDRRGIDVGALYRPELLTLDTAVAIPVKWAGSPEFATRDILYLKMIPKAWSDTLHIFFNHWPSRYGGQAQSEPKRMAAAALLKRFCDSLQAKVGANLIIAGDFNDEWDNKSLLEVLQAAPKKEATELINLAATEALNMGSHRYRGVWSYLDQVIVSAHIFQGQGSTAVVDNRMFTHRPPFLLEKDERFPGKVPFRTFKGYRYHGGFSDHLPVYIWVTNSPP